MNLLELFAGSRSVGKEAEKLGWNVFSSDIEAFEGINLIKDIIQIQRTDIPFIPDVIWFSPDCSTYSIAACSTHRQYANDVPLAKSGKAVLADNILDKIHTIISWFPDAVYFIENPMGLMRKMPSMKKLPRKTVTYCQYGDTRMKPTDIWTNCTTWKPRPMCKNGDKCHEAAPRGSKTGTQGRKGSYERSKIPTELCREILLSCMEQ